VMHTATLHRAIDNSGFPWHPDGFGRGMVFYWSEVQEWLSRAQSEAEAPAPVRVPTPPVSGRRGPGRPRKNAFPSIQKAPAVTEAPSSTSGR
jgi:hypothetical protein